MRFRSTGVAQLKNFLSILFGLTFGAILLLLLISNSVPLTTTLGNNRVAKDVEKAASSHLMSNSRIHMVTVPDLRSTTKKPKAGINDIHENATAKWPKNIQWPRLWTRKPETWPENNNDTSFSRRGNSFTCDMRGLTNFLKPALPRHFTPRKFHVLPKRYNAILPKPNAAPNCGTSGLIFPKNLTTRQDTVGKNKKLWMLFVVKSAPSHEKNRMSVRDTWGSSIDSAKFGMFVLFVIGQTNDENVEAKLEVENRKFGDILQCDFMDEYHALPIKILSTFRWILEQDLKVEFITMTDDDCLVNLPRIKFFIEANVTNDPDYHKNVYCGLKLLHDGKPHRLETKWALSIEQYSGDFFPTFCHGGLWTLSPQMMKGIYCMSEITDTSDFFLEDVLLTGILREKLNFKATNIKQMVKTKTPVNEVMLYHVGNDKKDGSIESRMSTAWKPLKRRWESTVKRVSKNLSL